jgi:hypothetical protein
LNFRLRSNASSYLAPMLRKIISLAYSRRACKLHCHASYAYVFARKKINNNLQFLHISSCIWCSCDLGAAAQAQQGHVVMRCSWPSGQGDPVWYCQISCKHWCISLHFQNVCRTQHEYIYVIEIHKMSQCKTKKTYQIRSHSQILPQICFNMLQQ